MPKATWDNIEGSPWEDELDDIPIYDGELPPKGVYRLRIKLLRLKKNSNGDPMINGLVIVNEPAGSKKVQYNGYDTWFNLNVTNQGSRWVNNFLQALAPDDAKAAALRKAFWGQKVMVDKQDPPNILSIGGTKITENLLISAQLASDTYNGETRMIPKRFLRPADFTVNEDDGYDTDDEDEEGWEESEDVEDEGDEEFDGRVAELEEMERPALLKEAKSAGISVKRGTPESDIIDSILAVEFPEEPDDEDEEEVEEEEVAEEEPEPEPAPRRRRKASAAKAAEPAEEPAPARARTGTRRRRAGSGNPPF